MPRTAAKKAAGKRRPGRPVEYTPEVIADIKARLERYISRTKIPILAEFAYKNHLPRTKLYEFEELQDAIKELIDKKEANLERLMISGIPGIATGCIFSLKQLGWKDRQEITGKNNGPVVIQVEYVNAPPDPDAQGGKKPEGGGHA